MNVRILLLLVANQLYAKTDSCINQVDLICVPPVVRPVICGSESLYATEEENVIEVGSQTDTIPAHTECTWTIANKPEQGELRRSILIYLKINNGSYSNQCVRISDPTAPREQIICAQNGRNVFESGRDPITLWFPGILADEQLNPINIYYKLGNIMDSNCGSALLTAEDAPKRLQVPTESKCTWLLSANSIEPIVVYTKSEKVVRLISVN
ncbi:hypothetical protein D915_010869 [Fasciola hepatica]|uniref:CUB domain-containing protein n=1 Tax=Fasciola hepatica TaxID=6192 RepID=A0A4E0RAK1_FASHE|nr:hypothetical protein D915_010869 [Fasciola hepatica]